MPDNSPDRSFSVSNLADLARDAIGLPIGLLLEEAKASRLVDRPLELSLFRLRLLGDPQKVGPLLLLLGLGGAGVGSAFVDI